MQQFTFWVHLRISHNFQNNWEFPYFLKPKNEKLFVRNSKFLNENKKHQNSSDFLNFENKMLNLAHHFHLSNIFVTLECFVNLDFWQRFRNFVFCGFKAWIWANIQDYVPKVECLDFIFWNIFLWKINNFIFVFENSKLVWDGLNFKLLHEFVFFLIFFWNLPFF